mmetsp:Transcript_71091/g.224796  ORF Transcript_71091/g.224796 Transcript_71091/m.224796 type:complete len:384 (+) Transcript_71091:332-1483(+)
MRASGGVPAAVDNLIGGRASADRVMLVSIVAIALVLMAAAFHWLGPVLVPLILASLLNYAFAPLVDLQVMQLRVPHPLAVMTTMAVAIGAATMLGMVVTTSIQDLIADIKMYEGQLKALVASALHMLAKKGVSRASLNAQLADIPIASIVARTTNDLMRNLLTMMEYTCLVMIFVVYMLLGRTPGKGPRKGMVGKIESRIKHYLFIKVLLSMAMGLSASVVLAVLKVHLALLFGVLTFVLNFIPNIGAVIAVILPIPLMMVSPDSTPFSVTLAMLLPSLVHIVIGYGVEPKVMGDGLDLHPITVLLCLIFWGMLWGIPGMLLAAPITGALKIMFETLEVTRPLAKLLGGRVDELIHSLGSDDDGPATPLTDRTMLMRGGSGLV